MPDLETPATPAAPDTTPPATAVPPEPSPAEAVDPVEADAVEVQGKKLVPLSALKEERERAKNFKNKADAYDHSIGYLQQVKPYIDFLQANPDVMTKVGRGTPAEPPATPIVDERAAELAKTLDLYTPEGKPDVGRAQKLMTVVEQVSDAKAAARVQPLAESTTRERSGHNYLRALATKTQDGRAPDKATLDAIWARVDPNITATEEGATAIVMLALGAGAFQGQVPVAPGPPGSPPVVTERPGSRTGRTPSLTALDESLATLRGRSTDDWNKLTRTFNPGRPNILED